LASTGTLTYGLSVGEVLGVSTLAEARLIGGASGVGRIVQRLNVMEVPDILAWVKPHELLLTTGYPLRNTPQSLDRLVTDLDERGLAALAIKLGRYLDDLPPEMVEQADRLGFPLILLPNDVGFDEILNQVLTDILNRQAAILARTEEVHRALVQIVLCGGGLQEVTDEVAALLSTAVVVVDGDGRWLAASGPEEEREALRGVRPGSLTRGVRGDHAAVPVVAGGFDHGRIVAYNPARSSTPGRGGAGTGKPGLGETDLSILERAATVAALVITKQQAVTAVESKYRADFLRDVLSGRAGSDERIIAHCSAFGWDLGRPVAVLVAELDQGAEAEERQAQERLTTAWSSAVRRRDRQAAVASFAHEVVAVVGVSSAASAASAASAGASGASGGDEANSLLTTLAKEASALLGEGRWSFTTGISRTAHSPSELPDAYDQAVKAVKVGRQLHGPGAAAHFDQLGVYRLLSLVPDAAELHAFVKETLGDLSGDGDAEAADLRRTLQVLLETNLNVAETARRLHFHYNTLRYRIGKLERMLGPFTEDAHLRLNLTLALHVLRMRGI
jgi:purine catabolism regulator